MRAAQKCPQRNQKRIYRQTERVHWVSARSPHRSRASNVSQRRVYCTGAKEDDRQWFSFLNCQRKVGKLDEAELMEGWRYRLCVWRGGASLGIAFVCALYSVV